jgi:acyl-CoA reductase-like NAD-dependent aldehyde dehydrogenase
MEAALAAAGAPAGLVSFVTGYGDAGHALVTGGVDKVREEGGLMGGGGV